MAAGQAPVEAGLPRIFGFFGFFLVFSMVLLCFLLGSLGCSGFSGFGITWEELPKTRTTRAPNIALMPALQGILAKALENALQGRVYMISWDQ